MITTASPLRREAKKRRAKNKAAVSENVVGTLQHRDTSFPKKSSKKEESEHLMGKGKTPLPRTEIVRGGRAVIIQRECRAAVLKGKGAAHIFCVKSDEVDDCRKKGTRILGTRDASHPQSLSTMVKEKSWSGEGDRFPLKKVSPSIDLLLGPLRRESPGA